MDRRQIIIHISFMISAITSFLADQLSKLWIVERLALGQSEPPDGWVRLTHIRNTGVAFGLFPNQTFIITLAAIAGLVVLLIYYRLSPFRNLYTYLGLGFILGGSCGNLVDRIRLGYVTDFIDFRVWPIFNLGDSAVVFGSSLMLYFFLFRYKSKNQ